MDMSQLAAVGVIGAILSLMLKKQKPEFSLMIGAATGIIIFLNILEPLGNVIGILRTMAEGAGINMTYLGIVFKVIAIAYIAEFGVQLCQDAGEGAIGAKLELAGKILILVVSAPVILALMDMVMNIAV